MYDRIIINGINVSVKTLFIFALDRLREDAKNGDLGAEELSKCIRQNGLASSLEKLETRYQDDYDKYIKSIKAHYNYRGDSLSE